MSLPDHHEKTESSHPHLGTARNRLAIALLGLAGSSAMPACTASFCTDANTPDSARVAAVDEDGQRIFVIPDAIATVHLMKSDKDPKELKASLKVKASIGTDKDSKEDPEEACMCDKTKIRGILNVLPSSPIFERSEKSRAFGLPESAYPWTKLIVSPSGKGEIIVSMRMEGDQIAMVFDCSGSTVKEDGYCKGKEMDPKELNNLIAANSENSELEKKAEANKEGEETGKEVVKADKGAKKNKEDDESEENVAKNDESTDAGKKSEPLPTEFPTRVLLIHTALKAVLKPVLEAKNLDSLKELARKLAGKTYKVATEKLISEIEQNTKKKEDLINPILIMFKDYWEENPDKIKDIAKELGITLPDIVAKPDNQKNSDPLEGTDSEAGKEESSKVLDKIKSLLNPTPLDKLKMAAKMISVEGFHKKIDEEDKGQVTTRLMDLLGKYYRSKDFVPLMKVLNFLKGELNEKSDTSTKEKAVVAEFRRLQIELRKQLEKLKRAKEDFD